ncbi:MAG TPA: transglutaminase-like domain-containing protein [Anaerolineae bacterium]|nr:transglutaminase-like domain-containing protein [Anaerolineae bacterium]
MSGDVDSFSLSWGEKLLRILGPKGLLVWGVLLAILISVISGLTDVVKGVEFEFAFLLMLLAATGGWFLSMLPVKDAIAAGVGLFLGFEVVFVRVGRLEGKLFLIFETVFRLIGQMLLWLWVWLRALAVMLYTRTPLVSPPHAVDWARLPATYVALWDDLGALFLRTWRWLGALARGNASYDPIATALIWGLVVWLCAWWAGWTVNRRHQPLIGILPGGILVSFLVAYTWSSTFVLLPLIGFTFLLMALESHRDRENRWEAKGTDYSRDLWRDMVAIAASVSLAVVLMAALSPLFTVERLQKITEWVEDLTQKDDNSGEPVAESLGIQPQPPPREVTPIQRAQTTTLPRRHLINSGPELSRMVVMLVRTDELPEIADPVAIYAGDIEVPRHYWRSITYDRYYGQGWSTSATSLIRYEAGELLTDPELLHYYPLRQEVQMVGARDGAIYVDGMLLAADEAFEVYWRAPGDMFAATLKGDKYRADSLVLDVTDEELRNAEGEIPAWLMERYTQLPETLPSRVRDLAFELTATEPTFYDRAKAIEGYLRHFSYTLEVPTPGLTADIADYFLFELQKGYCDYYATSMVVLARAAGMPARMVIGYASGNYQPQTARYVVTEADAHAWPEIYFPGIGWVEFEPTGGYPEIERGSPESESMTPPPDWDSIAPLVQPPTLAELIAQVGRWTLAIVGSVVGGLLLMTGVDTLFLLVWGTPADVVTRLYHRLQRYRRSLRARVAVGDTPYEVGASLTRRIVEIGAGRELSEEWLPPAADEIQRMIEFYIRVWYTPQPLTRRERFVVTGTWWVLRWRLWLAFLLRGSRRAPLSEHWEPAALH